MPTQARKTCEACGGVIVAWGKRRETARFCSKACQSRLTRAGRTIPHCEQCQIEIKHTGALRGTARFCSRSCQRLFTETRNAKELTQERLQELLHYDPATGQWRWKDHKGRRATPAQRTAMAGWADDLGYTHIRVDDRLYLAHRLAWLYVHGEWPSDHIDHRDGVDAGDQFTNIRRATQQQNTWNTRISKANKSGFKGVSWDKAKQRWRATISINGRHTTLGRFDTPEEAHAAYARAASEHFGEFARTA